MIATGSAGCLLFATDEPTPTPLQRRGIQTVPSESDLVSELRLTLLVLSLKKCVGWPSGTR
jgi:hypothetical protein